MRLEKLQNLKKDFLLPILRKMVAEVLILNIVELLIMYGNFLMMIYGEQKPM